jgi:3-oxoacyl-[acyl-carrier protein] reductase
MAEDLVSRLRAGPQNSPRCTIPASPYAGSFTILPAFGAKLGRRSCGDKRADARRPPGRRCGFVYRESQVRYRQAAEAASVASPMKIIRGKRALITGAASGIGRAIAMALAEEGADLYLVDLDASGLEHTARDAGRRGVEVLTAVCDLREPAQISAAVRAVRSHWDGLHILINNAGVLFYGPTHRMTDEQWNGVMAVNLAAPIQLARELLPTLLRSQDAHLVNICSIFGLVSTRNIAAYQTSKHGLVGFTEALRTEYGGHGFGVTAICPGFVSTPMMERVVGGEPEPNGRSGKPPTPPPAWIFTSPEKIAAKTVAAIRKNRGLVVVTPAARLLWWLKRLSPGMVDWVSREGWRSRGPVELEADHLDVVN